jgi:hypothetical protein
VIHIARLIQARQGRRPMNPTVPLTIAAVALLAADALMWWG